MPICPRCGKSMSSEQALMYHLNKRYKCNSWKCNMCNELFNTKFQLQMHEINCICDKQSIHNECDLKKLYEVLPFTVLGIDNDGYIHNVNPNAKCDIKSIIGKNYKDISLNIMIKTKDFVFCY